MRAADKLDELAGKKSDINEHLLAINELASGCEHITEFGVRNVVSTWALLAARPKRLVCYDIHDPITIILGSVLKLLYLMVAVLLALIEVEKILGK